MAKQHRLTLTNANNEKLHEIKGFYRLNNVNDTINFIIKEFPLDDKNNAQQC